MKEEEIRKLIGRVYIKNYHASKRFTLKHFLAMRASKSAVYLSIQRYEKVLVEKRNIGRGRKAEKLPPEKVKGLIKYSVQKK